MLGKQSLTVMNKKHISFFFRKLDPTKFESKHSQTRVLMIEKQVCLITPNKEEVPGYTWKRLRA